MPGGLVPYALLFNIGISKPNLLTHSLTHSLTHLRARPKPGSAREGDMGSEGPLAWCYELCTLTHSIDKLFRDVATLCKILDIVASILAQQSCNIIDIQFS